MSESYSIFTLADRTRMDRLRRRAQRFDMRLEKSRQGHHAGNLGGLMLIDRGNIVVAGVDYDLDLNQAAYWIDFFAKEDGLLPADA